MSPFGIESGSFPNRIGFFGAEEWAPAGRARAFVDEGRHRVDRRLPCGIGGGLPAARMPVGQLVGQLVGRGVLTPPSMGSDTQPAR